MIVREGTVYGEPYYAVEPNKWFMELETWCVHTFGCPPIDGIWKPHQRWYMNDRAFWFRDKKDLEWFLLRWQ